MGTKDFTPLHGKDGGLGMFIPYQNRYKDKIAVQPQQKYESGIGGIQPPTTTVHGLRAQRQHIGAHVDFVNLLLEVASVYFTFIYLTRPGVI